MKKYACLFAALLLFVVLFTGCEREGELPTVTDADETTAVITTTDAPSTSEPEEAPDGLREIAYQNDNGIQDARLHISLPESMSMEKSIIMDMEFEGFGDANSPPEPPRKVGEIGEIYELAPGETLEDLANPAHEEPGDSVIEVLDSGEFTGRRGNRIYYEIKVGGELGAYWYKFYIMLDDSRAVIVFLWNNVYTPEVDLPRFKEIAATVRP